MPENNPLSSSNSMLQLVLDSIPSRVFWKNRNLVYLGGNQHFLRDAGAKNVEDLKGKTDYDLAWSREQADAFRADDQEVMQSGKAKLNIEEPQTQADGGTSWLQTSKVPLFDDHGTVIGVLGTYTDITERKTYEQKIAHQANHDQLTRLPNRRCLQANLHNLINQSRSDYAALLMLNLDHFKTINDSLGHETGDLLLQAVATRIQDIATDHPQPHRVGGDEFALIVRSGIKTQEDITRTAMQLADDLIAGLALPFHVASQIHYLGASVGVTLIPPQGKDIGRKLQQANLALYAAKNRGRNCSALYDQTLGDEAEHKHLLQNELRHALSRGEFKLAYQPQYDFDGNLIGAEALLRWQNQKLGPVRPDLFIPLAEQTGIIHSIGDWVIDTAMSLLDRIHQQLPQGFVLAINISPIQFQREHFDEQLEKILQRHQAPQHFLQIEITESSLLTHAEDALQKLHRMKAGGLTVAIDDFGTGYSSLAYLARLPLDKLKIDQSFVRRITSDRRHACIVETIINMTETLGLEVIAEGVETEREKDFLHNLNCHQYQGYLFSKPLLEADFLQLIDGALHPRNDLS